MTPATSASPASPASPATGTASATAIDAARARGHAALIAYLPVGFPDLATSVAACRAAIEGGADLIELGMPYSDPLMDGPVIQHAVEAALRAGTRTRDLFAAVDQLTGGGVPTLVMTYWNPVERYGTPAFARDLAAAGGAGLITPDLIPDEAADWLAASDAHHLERIFLVAPSSTPARIAATAAACRGWVYAASTMGVTGERASVGARAEQLVADTRAAGATRVCVGLGVSRADQAADIARYADGVIVGAAFVRALTEAGTAAEGVEAVRRLAADLAAGIRGGAA